MHILCNTVFNGQQHHGGLHSTRLVALFLQFKKLILADGKQISLPLRLVMELLKNLKPVRNNALGSHLAVAVSTQTIRKKETVLTVNLLHIDIVFVVVSLSLICQ